MSFATPFPCILITIIFILSIRSTSASIYPTQTFELIRPNTCTDNTTEPVKPLPAPTIKSIFPSSIQNATIVIQISLEDNEPDVLSENDLLISWSWPAAVSRKVSLKPVPYSSRSQRIRISPSSTSKEFYIELELEHDATGVCNTDTINRTMFDGFCPLWKRQTYFSARLINAAEDECKFSSKISQQHGDMLLPCPVGTYMRVFKEDNWFSNDTFQGMNVVDYQHITADSFLDFTYRPNEHGLENITACVSCDINPGLECPIGSAGFHGGVKVKKNFWRVDYAVKAEYATARCRTPNVCEYGGRCAESIHRNGTLCELCNIGYGLRAGKCVSCDAQDYTTLGIVAGLILVIILIIVLFRRQLSKYRFLWRDVIRISKVIIDSSQILAAMPIVLDGIEWPNELLVMMNYLDLSSLDFTQYIGMACWGGKQVSYYTKATVLLSFMATALFILYVIYKISIVLLFKWWATAPIDDKETFMRTELSDLFDLADYDDSGTLDEEEIETVITKMSNKQVSATVVNAFKKIYVEGKDVKELERPEFIKFLLTMNVAKTTTDAHESQHIDLSPIVIKAHCITKQRSILTLITPFILILHTPITAKVFALFTCHRIGGPDRMLRSMNIMDRKTMGYLKADYGAYCLDIESHWSIIIFYIFAFIFLAVVTVGFPIALSVYMYKRKDKLYTYEVWSHIGFIYERFHHGAEFTDLHILMYKTCLCAGIVLLQDFPAMQRAVGTAIATCYLTWYAYVKPMRNPFVTDVCLYGIATTCFFYLSSNVFAARSESSHVVKSIFTYLMIIAAFGLFVVGAVAVYYSMKLAHETVKSGGANNLTKGMSRSSLRKSMVAEKNETLVKKTSVVPLNAGRLAIKGGKGSYSMEFTKMKHDYEQLQEKYDLLESKMGSAVEKKEIKKRNTNRIGPTRSIHF